MAGENEKEAELMALKALMLRKKLNDARKALEALETREAELATREAELEKSIEEAETEEERTAVDEAVTAFEADKEALGSERTGLEEKVAQLESELAEEEREQDTTPPAEPKPETPTEDRGRMKTMNRAMQKMTIQERAAFVENESVKAYLGEIRAAIKEKRAITNVGLTIPEVMLGILRENVIEYSKLYRHVDVRPVSGEGRMVIMGAVPEAIWTECCANLNELSLTFNDVTVDCFKVAGYFAVCNANLEDSDIDLAGELLDALGQAISLALDKAILYGRNSSAAQNMPLGIVSRLAQTEAPSGYPATARPWVDLHTTNIVSVENLTGDKLFAAIIEAAGAAKGKYARGSMTWVMNEKTYTSLIAAALSINAAGAIATGINGTMPVVGGDIEVLNFVPDNVIVAGYFDLYLLAERRGSQFAQSEHVRFLQDQTVMKGVARYDGQPAIAEGFVAIGLKGTTPAATGVTFAAAGE